MKIVIAPDSFKGTLSADQVCGIIEKSIYACLPEAVVIKQPISDGGEGLVDSLLSAVGGERIVKTVKGPLFQPVAAEYGIISDQDNKKTAVIEMAAASGLPLVDKNELNPLETTTYGTGELIVDAIESGCSEIILGLGGSATVDGGIGAGAALGIRYLDANEKEVSLSGKGLENIARIDTSNLNDKLKDVKITIACDVNNPLCGSVGSAAVYGPQKGADDAMVNRLDRGLFHLAEKIEEVTGEQLGDMPGMGAAGGLALPFVAFFGAQMKSGLDTVLDALAFDALISGADLIVTGEGRTDEQSAMGKVLDGVSGRAKAQNIPVVAISGALGEHYEALYERGLTAAFATWKSGRELNWQLEHAEENLKRVSMDVFQLVSCLYHSH